MPNSHLIRMFLYVLVSLLILQGNVFADGLEFSPLVSTEEFVPINSGEVINIKASQVPHENHTLNRLRFPILALMLTIFAGLILRFKHSTTLRPLFLMGSLVIFGFYNGGCPCVLGSFQNFILFPLENSIDFTGLVLFPGIILLTFIFGKTFCGWVCHLGALQEFIYKSNRLQFLKSPKTQTILRTMRYIVLASLLLQLIITKENLFEHIDPFRVAFNLTSRYPVGWVLLGLLLLTSLFLYRPFCNGVCPVGLVLSQIEKIPWAIAMRKNSNCIECNKCTSACSGNAIRKNEDLITDACIMCGDCMNVCKANGISPSRRKYEKSQALLPTAIKI